MKKHAPDDGEGWPGCYAIMLFIGVVIAFVAQDVVRNPIILVPDGDPQKWTIERVLMHGTSDYTLMYREDLGSPVITSIRFPWGKCSQIVSKDFRIIADVSPGESPFAEVQAFRDEKGREPCSGEDGVTRVLVLKALHIRSGQDIGGGNWNHGSKHGHGTTIPLE